MAETNPPSSRGFVADLMREESRLPERIRRVLLFDASVYAEIESDPHALPAAFTVVLVTAVLVGLGRPSITEIVLGRIAAIFLGIAVAIAFWGASAALVWAIGTLVADEPGDYPDLLRCAGFACAWNALAIGASLPFVGPLLEWGGPLLWAASLVLATRQVFRLSTGWAGAVCAAGLGVPLVFLALVA
jgi:hypothetical protein